MKAESINATGRCILIAVCFLGLSAGSPPDNAGDTPETSQAINEFTLALLKHQASAGDAPANVVLSPQSIFHGLAMSYIASGGKTRTDLTRVCRFPADDRQLMRELATIQRELLATAAHRRVDVCLANGAWLDETHADFQKDYLRQIGTANGGSLNRVNFADKSRASSEINRWISEKTRGKIRQVVNPQDFASRSQPGVVDEPALVIANAVYFKADWGSQFDKSATRDQPFHVYDAMTVNARMMHQQSVLSYSENEQYKFLEIPYIDDLYSMYVLLPKTLVPVNEMLGNLTTDMIAELKRNAFSHQVDVMLPKFTLSSHSSVKSILGAMGAISAFDKGSANFDRMIIKKIEAFRIYMSEIYHAAWIDVHEEGTKAAAATTTVHYSYGCSAASPPPPAEFHADHPFAYLVIHNESRSILFGGWVSNP